MRGPECHPWAEKIFGGSVRVTKNFSEPPAGACAARGCAQVTADENRKARSEKTNQCFSQNGAQRSSFRGTPKVSGRRPGDAPAVSPRCRQDAVSGAGLHRRSGHGLGRR